MDLFIETPRDVTERLTRAQQREIEALRAASAAQQAEAQRLWQQQARMHQEQARLAALCRRGNAPAQAATPPPQTGAQGAPSVSGQGAPHSSPERVFTSPHTANRAAASGTPGQLRRFPPVASADQTGVLKRAPGVTVRSAIDIAPVSSGSGERLPSNAPDAYAVERAYEEARIRKSRALAVARVLLAIVLAPVALFAVFLLAYALTCILNGASPDELGPLMGEALSHTASFFSQVVAVAAAALPI